MLRQAINLFLPSDDPEGSIRGLDLLIALMGRLGDGSRYLPPLKDLVTPLPD